MVYDVAIIGSGPAGLTAGIYMTRGQFSTIIIEGIQAGGQLMTTSKVENWPGTLEILGPDLMANIKQHAQSSGCTMVPSTVTGVNFAKKPFSLTCENGQTIQAKSVIIATGSSHKKLGCKGELEYWGKGVSVCATCDAPLYQDREVVIIGGGNTAMVEAEHLSHVAKKITIINLLDDLSATDPLKLKVLASPKVTIKHHTSTKEIQGDGLGVTQVLVEDTKTHEMSAIKTDAVFVAIGLTPNSQLFKDILKIDAHGYLVVTDGTQTSIPGVFAAGEVADSRYRQAVTSAGFGCMAALDCENYLK